jgi:hypothetical protein
MASAERSMSSSLVDQFETDIRNASAPCLFVPLAQVTPPL